jgi:hypothetical protein
MPSIKRILIFVLHFLRNVSLTFYQKIKAATYLCNTPLTMIMKKFSVVFILLITAISGSAQDIHIGIFGGFSAYNGDLTDKIFPKKVTNGAIGITGNYEFSDQIMIRAGLTYSVVGGADRFSKDTVLIHRNLSFETSILEFSLIGEYYFMNLYETRISPYVFAGLAAFHFNPYAYDLNKQKVYLKPLSTEGQGIAGYPDRKPYHLTQIAIPFGGGIKFVLTDKIRVGVELGLRKLFTDYLDDVSKNYIDENDLLAAKGQLAVNMSYRGDEAGGSPFYPAKGAQRGNDKVKDYYYFSGVHLTYNIGNPGLNSGGRKSKTGCPASVY